MQFSCRTCFGKFGLSEQYRIFFQPTFRLFNYTMMNIFDFQKVWILYACGEFLYNQIRFFN